MNVSQVSPLLLIALSSLALTAVLDAASFPRIRAVQGVVDVVYDAPFLIILTGTDAEERMEIRQAVEGIVANGEDPDAAALETGYNLRFYYPLAYERHKTDKALVEKADTLRELKSVFRGARFAVVVDLDWESEAVIVAETLYQRSEIAPFDSELRDCERHVGRTLATCRERNIKPERLLCFEYTNLGQVIYPVYDGQIRAQGKDIPFDRFAKMLVAVDKRAR